MNRLILTITAASILGHAIVGCCSHTVHFAACHALPTIAGEHATHGESHSHHHHAHDGTSPCHHAPDEHHDCQHAKCQWLASSANVEITFTSSFQNSWDVYDEVSTEACAAHARNLTTLAQSPPALPVRSHLALGVLLI